MKDIIKSITQNSTERIKNPFVYSFVVAWIAMNWESFILVLFSELKIVERIELVKSYSDEFSTIYYPLVIAIIYVLVLPYFMWGIERIIGKAKSERKLNHFSEQKQEWIEKQKIAKEERKYELVRAGNAEISELNSKIEGLQNEIMTKSKESDLLRKKLSESQENVNYLKSRLTEDLNEPRENYDFNERKNLDNQFEKFKKSKLFNLFENLAVSVSMRNKIPLGFSDLNVEKFVAKDILQRNAALDNGFAFYQLTKKGEYFWKKYVNLLDDDVALNLVKKQIKD